MRAASPDDPAGAAVAGAGRGREFLIALALLWLAGVALRLPILSVPPVITDIQRDLAMSGTEVGVLSGLPIVIFAVVALVGALLIARLGALNALLAGLLLAVLGTAVRGLVGSVASLLLTTALLGAGIAVMQPALPALVRQWVPSHIGLGTAVFTNGLIVGEIVPVAIMLPVVMPLAQDSWRVSLAFWALPLLAIAGVIGGLRPSEDAEEARRRGPARAWPDWRKSLTWRLGLILGGANAVYFGANTFLPPHLHEAGAPSLIGPALTGLNLGQLPASVLLLIFARRFEGRVWPLIACGLVGLLSLAGTASTASGWTIVFATVVGFCAGGALALSLALPALLCPPEEVAPTSAAMFAIGYTQAVLASVLGGATWDLAGSAPWAFVPVALTVLPLACLPLTLAPYRGRALPRRGTAGSESASP